MDVFDPVLGFLALVWNLVEENQKFLITLFLFGVALYTMTWFFYPWIKWAWHWLDTKRTIWKLYADWGKSMSKRAKDQEVSDVVEAGLSGLVDLNKITRKDKRHYLRLLAKAMGLEDLRPRVPHPDAVKNAILKRAPLPEKAEKNWNKHITAEKEISKKKFRMTTKKA